MENKEIKNLLIDLGGVLIDLDTERCIRSLRELGIRDAERLRQDSDTKGMLARLERGEITSAEFRDRIRRLAGRPLTDKEIDGAWCSILTGIPQQKLDLLLKLRENYLVYLLSNTSEIHWQWACKHLFPYHTFGVDDYFEKTYLSFEMGMAKPDPAIFKTVLADAGIEPEETLFIDDTEANCATARSLGLSTYTPKPQEDWSFLFSQQP